MELTTYENICILIFCIVLTPVLTGEPIVITKKTTFNWHILQRYSLYNNHWKGRWLSDDWL